MSERKIDFGYQDGSYFEAVVRDGEVVSIPPIKISPPFPWGGGAMILKQAIDFLLETKQATEETRRS